MSDRFKIAYSQNSFGSTIEILVDRETGVNYIWRRSCNAGGMTPLLGADGRPAEIISIRPQSLCSGKSLLYAMCAVTAVM